MLWISWYIYRSHSYSMSFSLKCMEEMDKFITDIHWLMKTNLPLRGWQYLRKFYLIEAYGIRLIFALLKPDWYIQNIDISLKVKEVALIVPTRIVHFTSPMVDVQWLMFFILRIHYHTNKWYIRLYVPTPTLSWAPLNDFRMWDLITICDHLVKIRICHWITIYNGRQGAVYWGYYD